MFGKKGAVKYEVRLARSADAYYQKQTVKIQKQFDKRFNKLSKSPNSGFQLKGELDGLWAIVSGNFRIEYRINEIDCAIEVIKIGPRGDIYKR